jgi:hypothetical protein
MAEPSEVPTALIDGEAYVSARHMAAWVRKVVSLLDPAEPVGPLIAEFERRAQALEDLSVFGAIEAAEEAAERESHMPPVPSPPQSWGS